MPVYRLYDSEWSEQSRSVLCRPAVSRFRILLHQFADGHSAAYTVPHCDAHFKDILPLVPIRLNDHRESSFSYISFCPDFPWLLCIPATADWLSACLDYQPGCPSLSRLPNNCWNSRRIAVLSTEPTAQDMAEPSQEANRSAGPSVNWIKSQFVPAVQPV